MDTQAGPLLDDLQAIRARATALVDRVPDDAAFQRQPEGGGWSVGQCFEHLTQTNRLYIAAIREAIGRVPREAAPVTASIRSTWVGRRFIASMEPGTMRFRSPKKVVPGDTGRREQVWAAFRHELSEIETLVRDAAGVDLNRPVFGSPFFGLIRLRAGTGLRVMLAHMRRHLQQAERVAGWHTY